MKLATFEQTILNNMGQQPTPLLTATLQKKNKKKCHRTKNSMPPHKTHIHFFWQTHKPNAKKKNERVFSPSL